MKKKTNKLVWLVVGLAVVTLLLTGGLLYAVTQQQTNNNPVEIDPDTMRLVQLEEPSPGDPIAIVETTVGEFRFRLFTEQSPNAAANFIKLANEGWYDDSWVYDAHSGVYTAMGSKQKSGELDSDIGADRERIVRELSQDLWSFRGAVCMVNTSSERTFKEKLLGGGTYYNGSRFMVLNTVELTEEEKNELLESSVSKELGQAYLDLGGIPNFAQQLTVIGQVYEGMDVAEKLASLEAETNGKFYIPRDEVKIISVRIDEYKAT